MSLTRSPSPPFPSTSQVVPTTTTMDFGSVSGTAATILIPSTGTLAAVLTFAKPVVVAMLPPSVPISDLLPSNRDDEFSRVSSVSALKCTPPIRHTSMKFIVGFIAAAAVLMPSTTLYEITPLLTYIGDYNHFPPLSRLAITRTTVEPSTASTGTILASLLLFV
ncbi:hypothetical protein IW261DRAFT_1055880 [Armillaria novae-zelandiae]|uniref:Uncharacterized protein n=1 Tax=Armillaria novae-zelandiae TaxID=153914 RepID=A0AA39NL79_9AGAR|nr:hypothetical protein IW261DRAFT_1055880 [Armillaria novae-zelandiae]